MLFFLIDFGVFDNCQRQRKCFAQTEAKMMIEETYGMTWKLKSGKGGKERKKNTHSQTIGQTIITIPMKESRINVKGFLSISYCFFPCYF